ncbi:glycosyl hydrolase [Candidatus Bathyarchaeota archaeon]|nr:glycosyl hydrolase [Candidatus Bathyarchaeota archaeon]
MVVVISIMSDVDSILEQLTIEEKVSLCSGFGPWSTKKIERLGIPAVFMSDGPHGPRWMKKQSYTQSAKWDMSSLSHLTTRSGYLDLLHPVTSFPSMATLGSSWNREILYKVGQSIGEECRELGIGLLLAPGVNIVRHPLCGRSYEYLSEDPVVAGELGSSYINGVQSTGVGATLKHFVCNNAEFERLSMDSIVEERALRELYLAVFERIVKQANPSMVMQSYNKVNGTSLVENKRLLTDILKKEWSFQGAIISDWWAVNDRADALNAGMDIEMPQNLFSEAVLLEAAKDGKVSMEQLNDSCRRILYIIEKYANLEKVKADFDAHHEIARKAAGESIVLLKNDGALPLKGDEKIAVIGSFAETPRYQGVGCSIVNPRKLLAPLTEVKAKAGNVSYAQGYDIDHETSAQLLDEATALASKSEVVILFAGLPEEVETETHDRTDYNMPATHIELIKAVSEINKNVIVVLQNGSAVAVQPWMGQVSAIVEAWLGGESGAGAVTDVLFGDVNPSGKIAITFPEKIEDSPGYLNFPGENGAHMYAEGIFVGYRYYEKKKITPTFPFGYGMSYTEFQYSGLKLDKESMTNEEMLTVTLSVTNTGKIAGKEIVQLYVAPHGSKLKRPEKELKEFAKIHLEPSESKEISFELSERAFAYYDDHYAEWIVDSGEYSILIGASSADIMLKSSVDMISKQVFFTPFTGESYCYNLLDNPHAIAAFKKVMIENDVWSADVTDEFIEAIRHNFIPLFKSVTRQTSGAVNRKTFDSWMEQVNRETYQSMKKAA